MRAWAGGCRPEAAMSVSSEPERLYEREADNAYEEQLLIAQLTARSLDGTLQNSMKSWIVQFRTNMV